MVMPFIAHPPGLQNKDTFRQFEELQTLLSELMLKLEELEARIASLEAAP